MLKDSEIVFALFRTSPVHIREEPEEVGRYTEDQRQKQRELMNDLIAEQTEQM